MEHHLERASDAAFASVTATFARYAVETLRVLLDAPVLDIDSSDSIQTLRDFSNGPVRCLSVALGGGIDDGETSSLMVSSRGSVRMEERLRKLPRQAPY